MSEIIDRQHVPDFNRYDIVVRYMAIESYYGLNDFGFDLYERMQLCRHGKSNLGGFKSIISSFEKNRYLKNKPIVLFSDGALRDGSHRLACSLYFGIKDIPVRWLKEPNGVDYSIRWFEQNGFPVDVIEEGRKRMFIRGGVFLIVTLWPPVSEYFEEMKGKIGGVLASYVHTMSDGEFNSFVRHQYSIDGANQKNIDKKMDFMSQCEKRVMLLLVNFGDPQYRVKRRTQEPISQVAEQVKKDIREPYSKKVDGYISDVVMHISDNYEHSQRVINGFEHLFR